MAANPVEFPVKSLQLTTRVEDGRATINCLGRLTNDGTPLLKLEVARVLPEVKHVVLDLSNLQYMDSSGLGSLVAVYVSCRKAGCKLQLINLNERIAQLLRLTKLASVFEGYGEYL